MTGKEIKTAEEILIENLHSSVSEQQFKDILSAMQEYKSQWDSKGIKWVKASENPKQSVECVCIVESIKDRADGKISHKPAYGLWNGDYWRTDEGFKVIEWLDENNLVGDESKGEQSKIEKAIEWCDEKIEFYKGFGWDEAFNVMKTYLLSLSNINK